MNKIFAEIKSIDELANDGFKFSESNGYVYAGNSNWPTYKFGLNLIHLLGQRWEVVSLERPRWRNEAKVEVSDGLGNTLEVPVFLIKNKLKVPKTKRFKLQSKTDEARYHGMGFHFPCKWQDLTTAEARQVAHWILKVTQ